VRGGMTPPGTRWVEIDWLSSFSPVLDVTLSEGQDCSVAEIQDGIRPAGESDD